jgi:hypothetical protein
VIRSDQSPDFHLQIEPDIHGVRSVSLARWAPISSRNLSETTTKCTSGSTRVRSYIRISLKPSEIEDWLDQGEAGMENALRAKPEDVREQYERQLKDLQEAYGEAILELRARKIVASLLGKD